ncbi:MAG: hypothetical protein L6R40_003073 [Gallowayella cf. fulva]|nr:MAG: hypothetical protein L6R40_003073 [Xanthomendoza cf. fulva]
MFRPHTLIRYSGFLLAYLQIARLSRQTSLKNVRRNINTLPMGVFASYEDAVKRIKEQEEEGETGTRALSYLFCPKRTLQLEELRHALAVEDDDTELDETAFMETEVLPYICGGLIILDEQSQIIRLVHHTLQQYLENNRMKLSPNSDAELARTCLTYLPFETFDTGPCINGETLEQRLQAYRFLDYASHHWAITRPMI